MRNEKAGLRYGADKKQSTNAESDSRKHNLQTMSLPFDNTGSNSKQERRSDSKKGVMSSYSLNWDFIADWIWS